MWSRLPDAPNDQRASGRIAVFWHTETLLLANDLAALRAYHALGMHTTGLVHASPLDWIDSDKEQHHPSGLTDFGRSVIREMNALGIVIDVSHASDDAIRDVTTESRQPIVATHCELPQVKLIRNWPVPLTMKVPNVKMNYECWMDDAPARSIAVQAIATALS